MGWQQTLGRRFEGASTNYQPTRFSSGVAGGVRGGSVKHKKGGKLSTRTVLLTA